MKKEDKPPDDAEMLDEYEFGQGVQGKYAQRYAEGSNVVFLNFGATPTPVTRGALTAHRALP